MIEVELPDGRIIEFPDGTDPNVIQSTARRLLGIQQQQPPIPQPVQPELAPQRGIGEQIGRSVAEGATLGFFPEMVAAGQTALGSAGIGPERTFQENVARQEAVQAGIPPQVRIPGNIAGGLATGAGVASALPRAAVATAPRAAAVGALEGAVAGAGFAPPGERVQGAATGAAIGGAIGAAAQPIGRLIARLRSPIPAAPTRDDLRRFATEAYEAADRSGLVVKQSSFAKSVQDLGQELTEAGAHPRLHPRAMTAFQELADNAALGDLPLKKFEILRRIAKSATASNEVDERRVGAIIINHMDDFLSNLKQTDTTAGDARLASESLKRARALWNRQSKAETIEEIIERASNRSGQFSLSGMENAIRTEFRQIAQNKKRLRLFDKQEQAAIQKIVRGGPIMNTLRQIGKFSPRSPIGAIPQLMQMGGLGVAMGPTGVAIGAGVAGATEGAKMATNVMARRRAARMLEQVLRGQPRPRSTPGPVSRSLILGGAPAAAGQFGPR